MVLAADAVAGLVLAVRPGPAPVLVDEVRDVVGLAAARGTLPVRGAWDRDALRDAPVLEARDDGRVPEGVPGRRGELTAPFSPTRAGPDDTRAPRVV
ncbi:hypothetical protein [Demequina sp. NBRC 110057]|uniref:hypothetical protein n=1 Tax=Demequina sp. NBRC 110057 TaxID=1570346 RepID=UPI000A06A59E|nr:hypothetical protein [Demequina sp. NBRC 110057]